METENTRNWNWTGKKAVEFLYFVSCVSRQSNISFYFIVTVENETETEKYFITEITLVYISIHEQVT